MPSFFPRICSSLKWDRDTRTRRYAAIIFALRRFKESRSNERFDQKFSHSANETARNSESDRLADAGFTVLWSFKLRHRFRFPVSRPRWNFNEQFAPALVRIFILRRNRFDNQGRPLANRTTRNRRIRYSFQRYSADVLSRSCDVRERRVLSFF